MISSNHVLSYLIIYFPEGVQARAAGRLKPGQVRSYSLGQGRTLQGCCQGEKLHPEYVLSNQFICI